MTTSLQRRICTNGLKILLIGMIIIVSVEPAFGENGKRRSISPVGILVGCGVAAGGFAYANYHFNKAEEKYERYQKSAFTANTTDLQKNVRRHENHYLMGGVLAMLGAITIVVSF